MEERTRAYLRGRFGDYYRRTDLAGPPAAVRREWGYIPWTRGSGTTMVRHNDLLDLTGGGSLSEFLARERPRHVYFSAGRYDQPGADTMAGKGWRGSDLVFDLDADHLPAADPDDTYGEMLAKCKDALYRLLDFLEDDFGFEDLTVVFSGGRGYHVHVRDEGVGALDRAERREVVDYLRGNDLDLERLTEADPVYPTGMGRETGTENRVLRTDGGWGRRTHQRFLAFVDDLRERDEEAALARLREVEGIGEKRARTVYGAITDGYDALAAGHVDARPGTKDLFRHFLDEAVRAESAPIDEPVTTDINRLIRLPGSLHGGSGLVVRPIPREDLDAFDPLVDAVPETFRDHDIAVEVREERPVEVGGDRFTLPAGEHSVPEYAGVFLMARGQAEKGKE